MENWWNSYNNFEITKTILIDNAILYKNKETKNRRKITL